MGDVTETDREQSADATASGDLAAGTAIGRYVVEGRLGAGGMGVVYSAWDGELARSVALKVVRPRPSAVAMQQRLRREAKAMARLSHPNVVAVFDIGTHDDQLFLAMERIDGETLRSWVDRPRPWREVVQLFVKAGRGLAAAHAAGLLHRDFKPDNVIVDGSREPRITDFGLARELASADAAPTVPAATAGDLLASITETGALAGTLAYMPPERVLGGPSGAQSDQFSYCVSLFEVLFGLRPFGAPGATAEAWIAEIRGGQVAKPAAVRDVPGWLWAIVVRGLALDSARRWPSMAALVGALERGLRRRRRRINAVVGVFAIAVAIGAVVRASSWAREPPAGCRVVAARGNDAATVSVCRDEYARTSDPWAGAQLASALRRTGNLRDAAVVGNELLATPARADALFTLGEIAAGEDRRDEAMKLLRLASEEHRNQRQWEGAATDLLAAAEFSRDFAEQLIVLERAAADARRAGASTTEAYTHLATAVVLSGIGAGAGAKGELARAESLATRPADRIAVDMERGNVHQNLGEHALAIAAFERALTAAQAVPIARRVVSARLNLAYSLAELGRLPDAHAQLTAASALDPGDRKLEVRLSIEAQIAARGGDPARAAELVERALAASDADAPDDVLELEVQRAEIALQQGDLAQAESWARRAIATIEKLRSSHPPVELRSWMVVDRRIPYEVLFASLAARGEAAQALVVFDRYRGLGALAALARGESAPSIGPGMGFPIADLARLLPALATSPLATPAAEPAILDAVRAGSLLALVVARGQLWRIIAEHGRLEVARVGPLAQLHPVLDRLRASPGDRAAAAELGAVLVLDRLARPNEQALHVVLDEPLGWIPVASLRVGDRPLIATRTIVHAARASAIHCARPLRGLPRRVTLDAHSSTRSSLFGIAREDRLRLAVPTEVDALGGALVMSDGRVRSLEIAGRGAAPAQVVLDVSGGGVAVALALAFVAAGSDQVIAPVHPVSRASMDWLVEQLDRADDSDLARSLARLQRARHDDELLGIAAFGRASCIGPP